MHKLFVVIKREYVQRIRSKMFVVTTVLGPIMLLLFTIVPGLIFSIKTGGPSRIAIIDQTGTLYDQLRASLQGVGNDSEVTANDNRETQDIPTRGKGGALEAARAAAKLSFAIEKVDVNGRDLVAVEAQLDKRVADSQLDGYVVVPADVLEVGKVDYYARNLTDVFTREKLAERISRVVVEQRMIDAHIAPEVVRQKSEPVKLSSRKAGEGGEEDKGGAFAVVFVFGFLIYISILMYGQAILGAVVEEKETRIAEMLFSSVKSFTLMFGKLVGVSLVALTQFAIWGVAFGAFSVWGLAMLAARGLPVTLPTINLLMLTYFTLFFLLGYFLYSTIYALVGSMVTTAQEGGQLALPIVFMLVIGFYLAFPVMQRPDSPFAFWISMVPFFSPITMGVRVITQTPPIWQIALSLGIGFATVILMMWIAARIYRIGMLMYGKKATIPEVLRWMRQS